MDKQVVQRILKELGGKADRDGIAALNRHQRNVLVPWTALGVIGNGGFEYFYQGDSIDPIEAASAFRLLGFEAVARACERSLSVFPDGRAPRGDAIWKMQKSVDWDVLRDVEDVVYDLEFDELEAAIGRYIFANADAFGVSIN